MLPTDDPPVLIKIIAIKTPHDEERSDIINDNLKKEGKMGRLYGARAGEVMNGRATRNDIWTVIVVHNLNTERFFARVI